MGKVNFGTLDKYISEYNTNKLSAPKVNTTKDIPDAPEYMAQENANINTILGTKGTESIYYAGKPREGIGGTWDAVVGNPFKNWVRKTWAAVHNPMDYLPAPTAEQNKEIEARVQAMKDKPYSTYHNYGENATGKDISLQEGYKAIEDVTGLDMNEIFQSKATEEVAKETGDVNVNLGIARKTATAVGGAAIMGALSAPEWIIRNGAAVYKAVDQTADQAGGADKDNVNLTAIEKFNNAVNESDYAKYLKKIPVVAVLQNADFVNVIKQMLPLEWAKDSVRLIANLDKVQPGQFTKNLNANLAGSQMIYSAFRDEARYQEYMRRYESGESPIKLVAELQDPMTELAGGILFDPTTYITTGAKAADAMLTDGVRDISKGIKSASVSNIDVALIDNRIPSIVQESIQKLDTIAKGNSTATRQQVLDEIHNTYKTVKAEFDVWKEARGVTSLVSSAKQKMVIEQATDFFRDIAARVKGQPDGTELMLGTLDAMKKLAQGGDEKEMAKAFSALVNSPIGQTPLSPRGMRIANMMAGLDEAIPGIQKAIKEGDVSKLADLYASQIEKVVNKSILSVNEMGEIAAKVKSGVGEITPEMEKIAKQYKDLPQYVKFFNGANELGKKTWLKPMGMFSELYFGANRFAYPVRNVLSAIPGMAYEFGLKNSVEMAVKSITGSQVEKLGVDMLTNMAGEMERLVGYIPGAFQRGDTAIGEFVSASKRYFGKFRGGGEVAAMSEQIMSAQIMLKTVQRELKNAIQYGAIPETKVLEAAGLHGNDAKALLKYAAEYGGDANQILDAFRKFMGGSEETFRHIPMNEHLDEFLEHIGNGTNSLSKELTDLRRNAKTVEEFQTEAKKIWEKVEGFADVSRTEPTKLSDDIPSAFVEDIKQAQNLKAVSQEGIDNFERVIQSFRNAKHEMVGVEETMKAALYKMGVDPAKFSGVFAKIRQEADDVARVDPVRRLVNSIRDNKNLTTSEMYEALEKTLPDFKISEWTQIDPTKINRREMEKVMWESYFQWTGKYYAEKANSYNKGVVATLQSMAESVGTTVDVVAKESGASYQEAIGSFETAYKYYAQTKIDSMSWSRIKVPTGVTLMDVDMDALKAAGFRSKDQLFNTINKYRVSNGDRAWQTHAQVDMWEVQDAVRRMKREQGFIQKTEGKVEKIASNLSSEYVDANSLRRIKEKAATSIQDAVKIPRGELTNYTSQRVADEAKRLISELSGGEAGGFAKAAQGSEGVGTRFGTSNVDWYKQAYKDGMRKPQIDAALQKIIEDHGKDKGVNVERMKEIIFNNFKWGDAASGTPPDLVVLQELGASDSVMNEALDAYNEITKRDLTLQEALLETMPENMSVTELPAFKVDFGEYEPILHPPIAPDQAVTPSRMARVSLERAKQDFDTYIQTVSSRWGETQAPVGALSDKIEGAMSGWVAELTKRMNQAKSEAAITASATRDAMLYDYRKSLWNVAAQYVSPFHYYHASASKQWLQNVAADPKWAAIYIDYKEYMASRHAGLPDFWKQNIAVSGLPGMDKNNPLFFNIEASVNPVYQMVGQDFNDPSRRKDWLSSTVDELSKVIPGIYQPLQWAVAANLYSKGEEDAAKKWAGRLIPQTKIIKSVTNAFGIDIPLTKYNELDPFVSILDDGLDPFEEKRVLRYLATMPNLTEEQRIDAAHSRTGAVWEEAVRQSLSARAGAEAASFFLGVGYKPRTQTDIITDKFYEDYRKLISARSVMNSDDYKDAWEAMRQQYPFMDSILIGKRSGEDRDTAFAYNVLSRVPPGEVSDIAAFVRLEPYMIEEFYAHKGDLSYLNPQDRDRFMASMLDLSVMLKLPSGATKQEWNAAKSEYGVMQTELKTQFGENILDQINKFFELPENERDSYMQTFPQVERAMQAQNQMIAQTPILAAYYGGLEATNRYYTNQTYITLDKEFGEDISDKVDYYYFLKDQGDTKAAKSFYKQNDLKAYFERKSDLQQQANISAVNAASQIPERKDYAIRPEFTAQSGIQQETFSYTQTDQQAQTAQQIWGELSPSAQSLIQDYYNGEDLPYSVERQLDYLGKNYGMSTQEVLRLLGLEQVK